MKVLKYITIGICRSFGSHKSGQTIIVLLIHVDYTTQRGS